MSVMTPTASHQAGNSRRDQLTAALAVGGVLVVLGAASGLGIEVSSGAALPAKITPAVGVTPPSSQPSTSAPTPVNYIGTPGPGNLPPIYPGVLAGATAGPRASASSRPTTSPAGTSRSSSPTPTGSSTAPNQNCPPDVVAGLLDVLLGSKGLSGASGLVKTVLSVLPDLSALLNSAGLSSVLTTDVGHLSAAQTNSMAQACTPVLSGLLGGGA